MKIYYDKEKALKNDLFCYGIDLSEEDLEKIKKEYVIYESETLFSGYPIVEGNILRQATVAECIELGYIKLEEGQIVEDNKIINVPKPENNYSYAYEWQGSEWILNEEKLPDGVYFDGTEFVTVEKPNGVKLVWNRETHIWDETATEHEKVLKSYEEYKMLDTPLNFEDMETAGVLEDYKKYMSECKNFLGVKLKTLSNENEVMPLPSEKLKNYFNSQITFTRGALWG